MRLRTWFFARLVRFGKYRLVPPFANWYRFSRRRRDSLSCDQRSICVFFSQL